MKIQLSMGEPALTGYTQVDPRGESPFLGDPTQLAVICQPHEATLIEGRMFVNYLDNDKLKEGIQNWANLLQKGGKLILGGTDFYIFLKLAQCRSISLQESQTIMNAYPYMNSLKNVSDMFLDCGLKINNKTIEDMKFTVEGMKV